MSLEWAMLSGAVFGLGLVLLVRALARPRPSVAETVARVDAGLPSMRARVLSDLEASRTVPEGAVNRLVARLADVLEAQAAQRGWTLGRTGQDLAIMARSRGELLATSVVACLVMLLLGPVVWAILLASGTPVPVAMPILVSIVLGVLGAAFPFLALRQEAAKRRKDFRRVVGIFLELVAMNLSGGRGLPEALLSASGVSEQWALVRIRQALANARLLGIGPWEALTELGDSVGVGELSDLAGALELAANDGAKIRVSLSARAETLRTKELAEAEGEEGERSQSMLVAQLLLSAGFLLFLSYPAVEQLALL